MEIKLLEYIPRDEFQFCKDIYDSWQVPVPTEVVVTEPKYCVPQYARVYRVHRWLVDGEILDYDRLRKLDNFHGTANYNQILLVEVWIDRGDDGHTAYYHRGYRFITAEDFQREWDNMRYSLTLPTCMYWYWKDHPYPEE